MVRFAVIYFENGEAFLYETTSEYDADAMYKQKLEHCEFMDARWKPILIRGAVSILSVRSK